MPPSNQGPLKTLHHISNHGWTTSLYHSAVQAMKLRQLQDLQITAMIRVQAIGKCASFALIKFQQWGWLYITIHKTKLLVNKFCNKPLHVSNNSQNIQSYSSVFSCSSMFYAKVKNTLAYNPCSFLLYTTRVYFWCAPVYTRVLEHYTQSLYTTAF